MTGQSFAVGSGVSDPSAVDLQPQVEPETRATGGSGVTALALRAGRLEVLGGDLVEELLELLDLVVLVG